MNQEDIVEGCIASYQLIDWWLTTFTSEERAYIDEKYQPMSVPPHTLTRGNVTTNQPSSTFLNGLATWFRGKKDNSIFERIHDRIIEEGVKRPVTGPGYHNGRHFTTFVYDVKNLERKGSLEDAESLLIELVSATESESIANNFGVAPWYYGELAHLYRKQKDFKKEIAILERFAEQKHARGVQPARLLERLSKAKQSLNST